MSAYERINFIMNKLRKTVLLAVLVVVVLAALAVPAMAKVNEYEGQHVTVQGDPSQWG
jgi:hypothetical protein